MSPAVSRVVEALEAAGYAPKPLPSGGYAFRCPCHEDAHASGALGEGDGGRALLFCHSCGKIAASIAEKIGLRESDLFVDGDTKPRQQAPAAARIVAEYDYHDERGELLYQAVRYEPKDFRQRRPDGRGGFVWNMADVRRVVYRLPAVLEAASNGGTGYVVEGEKDADAINALEGSGFVATTNVGGAGKWTAAYAEALRGLRRVIVVQDKDEPGRRHARQVAESCRELRIPVEIREARTGKDAADHLAAGRTLDELVLVEPSAERLSAQWQASTLQAVTDPNVGNVEFLIESLIPKGETTGIAATFKTAKSLATYSMVLAGLSARRVFGAFAVPRPLRVCTFQLEMPEREDARRFRRLALGMGIFPEEVPAYVAAGAYTHYSRVNLDLSNPASVAVFHDAVRSADAELVLLDSLIAAAGSYDVNDNGDMRRMFTAGFLPLTSEGRSIVFLHHKRKAPSGAKGKDADRDSFLGAQAIAAAAGRMYALERLDADDRDVDPTRFRCALTLFGSWTPEKSASTVLEIRDDGDGTTVTALDEDTQLQRGGITPPQRAALALAGIVRVRRSARRKAALAEVAADLGVSDRTAAAGLAFAKARRWLETERVEGSKAGEVNLVPGSALDGTA